MTAIVVKVHNGYFYKGQKSLIANSGKTTVIKAESGASYELILRDVGHAPEQLLIEKRGNNLLIAFEDKTQIDLVIKNFFVYPESQLVGLDKTGDYYSYLPVYDKYEAFFGKEIWLGNSTDAGAQLVELRSYGKITPWILEAETQPMSGLLKPTLIGLGGSALLLLGAESWRIDNKDTSSDSQAEIKPTIDKTGQFISGVTKERGTVNVHDENGNVIGTAKIQPTGKYQIKLVQAQNHQEQLTVNFVDAEKKILGSEKLIGIKSDNTSISSVVDVDLQNAKNTIAEDSRIGSKVGITASAKDYEKVTYSLVDNANGTFAIDKSTGVVTTLKNLDFEKKNSYTIKVRANSADGSNTEATFEINVTNANESKVSAIKDVDTKGNVVTSKASIGATVGITAKATDADDTDKSSVTYKILDNPDGLFSINIQSGVVTVAKDLSSQSGTKTIKVQATSSDGSTSDASFDISIGNSSQSRPLQSEPLSDTAESKVALSDIFSNSSNIDLSNITLNSPQHKSSSSQGNIEITVGDLASVHELPSVYLPSNNLQNNDLQNVIIDSVL